MSAPTPVASTYVAGDDPSRLKDAAAYLGLDRARRPTAKVREAVSYLLHDTTLEAARMHSIGTLASDERVDEGGTIHLMTLSRRRKAEEAARPEYGKLMDLFREPMEIAEEEEEDYEIIDTVEGGSLTAAVFGLVKATIGPAVLFLPRGFKLAGWAVAIPALIFSTVTYLYSASRLLECWKIEKLKVERLEEIKALLEDNENPTPSTKGAALKSNYGAMEVEGGSQDDTGPSDPHMPSVSGTMLTYPELARRAFGKYSIFVTFGIAVLQYGVCLTYFIFVPENMVQVTRALSGVKVPQVHFLVIMVLLEIPLAWIRDIRKLMPTNILASLLIAFGLASCLAIALFKDHGDETVLEKVSELPAVNPDTWFLFIGTSFYVFEGCITLVVPLQEAVFKKEDKEKFPAVNRRVEGCIVVFYIFFATTCWAAFGDEMKSALTASLPEGALTTTVQIAYSIAVFFTFPLQAFPALEVTLHTSNIHSGGKTEQSIASTIFQRNVKASIIICCLGVVGYIAQDYLGNVASILGSLVGVPIALIFPNIMHNILVKNSSKGVRLMNNLVAGIGLFATVVASTTTILNWNAGAE